MKRSLAAFTFLLISTGVIVTALRFIEPLDAIIRSKYPGMTFENLKPKCDSKDVNLYQELTELQSKEGEIRAQLTGALIAKARAMGQISDSEAEQWIQENCIANMNLINISKVAIEKAQICVDADQRLQGAEIVKAKEDLLKKLCWAVSISAKFVYMNN